MGSSEASEFKPGFTWRAAMAILLTSMIFLPTSLYIQLAAGVMSIPAIAVIMAILFSELSRVTGSPLTKQELFIIYQMSALAAAATCYIFQVFKAYIMTSPISYSFRLGGRPIPELIPSWWAPPPGSPAYELRTFIHPDWLIPLIVVNIQAGLFYYLVELSMTIMLAHLYIEVEKLRFPLAAIDAALITTLSERDPDRLRYFVISLYPGFAWGMILYLIPSITGYQIVPLPWVDLTPYTAKFMPGAIIGFMTDMAPYVGGLFVPALEATYMLIGSLALWVFGNYLTLTVFRDAFPEWAREYFYGLTIGECYSRSLLRVWVVPLIAFTFAAVVPIIAIYSKTIIEAFSSFVKMPTRLKELTGYPSIKVLLGMYIIGTVGSVIFFHLFVPDFPIWISFLMAFGLSFLNGIIATRSIGVTGYAIAIPNEWYAVVYLSGYQGIGAWIFQPVIGGIPTLEGGAPYWTYMIKVGYLTQTKPMDVVKALVYTIIVYNVLSFVWMEFFWRIAPIPSSIYPYALATWPAMLISQAVWWTRQVGVKPWLFWGSFFTMLGIGFGGELAARLYGFPFSIIGLVTGASIIPPGVIPVFIGSMLNKYVLPRLMGKERWERYRTVIAAGIMCGEGIAAGIAIACSLIAKATWIKPW
ncbi:MAG: hypothetical protein DRN15_05805 [Thermoprotei archaeon]|nr:MAG: hypothetical protein DRN15_05805 [Thermoprotei archaeon]RLF23849.1 MAG: hypothetical protein DRM97_04270 [Thermoprotei archaeon]